MTGELGSFRSDKSLNRYRTCWPNLTQRGPARGEFRTAEAAVLGTVIHCLDSLFRSHQSHAGLKRAELWRAELLLVPRGASSYMLLLRGSLCDGLFCSWDLLRADITGSR